ncbi:hypothetical protein EMCRGX_G033778 [Ephydatia muelleri]
MNSSIQSVCPFCPNITLDPLGHHAVSCRHGGDVVIRHNRLRNIFAEFCRRAHLSVRVEVGQGLSRVQSNSRPADVLVDAWDRAKPAAFDVTVTSPLTPATLHDACNSAGVAAHKAECRKHSSIDPKCQELGWVCVPLAVESYGNWGKEAQNTFARLTSILSISLHCPKAKVLTEIYGRLSISLVRSVARAILSRRCSVPAHQQGYCLRLPKTSNADVCNQGSGIISDGLLKIECYTTSITGGWHSKQGALVSQSRNSIAEN